MRRFKRIIILVCCILCFCGICFAGCNDEADESALKWNDISGGKEITYISFSLGNVYSSFLGVTRDEKEINDFFRYFEELNYYTEDENSASYNLYAKTAGMVAGLSDNEYVRLVVFKDGFVIVEKNVISEDAEEEVSRQTYYAPKGSVKYGKLVRTMKKYGAY